MTEDSALEAAQLHCRSLQEALDGFRRSGLPRIADWGGRLAAVLTDGGRLLAAGNGGSAAQAQHLTAELVGRYRRGGGAPSA
ncbi:phosphoheptose isomerase, partial [Streptomyces sp. 13-12-16]|uniref:SIS domain-containing protein n=1 Tax=Streptomyces sp. 13-12-16 TaxID=1570823 RepID=UPI000A24E4D2